MKLKPLRATIGALCVALGSAACTGPSEHEQIVQAKTSLDKGDTKTAVIQLKSLLQANANSGEARFLLGKALLAAGDPAAAAVEFAKALDLKYPEQEVAPLLARAWLASGAAKKVISRYAGLNLPSAAAQADLKSELAQAYALTGDDAASREAVKAALASVPNHPAALTMQARHLAAAGDIDGALQVLQRVIAADRTQLPALMLQGELLWLAKQDPKAGAQTFRDVIALNSRYQPAYLALASIYTQAGDVHALKAHVTEMKKALPNDPETRFLEAQLAFIDNDYRRAHEMTAALLTKWPDNVRLLQLAGLVELQLGSLRTAEIDLTKALQLQPNLVGARRSLAGVYLKVAQPERAWLTLEPLLSAPNPGADTLSLGGEIQLHLGDLAKAENLFQRASKERPSDAQIRTELALAKIAKGDSNAGLAQLESIAASDSRPSADLALIVTRLRRGETDEAIKAVQRLMAKQPDKPQPLHLLGRINLSRKDTAEARKNFEAALKADPAYLPAAMNLAALDIIEKHPDQALARFHSILERDPKNQQALLSIAEIKERMGASPADIEAAIRAAIKANPVEPEPRLRLVNHYLATHQVQPALSAAREALAMLPDDPRVLQALGQAQFEAGDNEQALDSLRRVATAQPNAAEPLLRLAEVQLRFKDSSAAQQSLRRALKINPDSVPAMRLLTRLLARDGHVDEALQIARAAQQRNAGNPAGYLLEGEIEANRRRWPAAITAYRNAHQRAKSTETAMGLHQVLMRSDQNDEAQKLASTWQTAHPKDTVFLSYLGSTELSRNEYAAAEAHFRKVVELVPNDSSALNNLAWALMKQGRPNAREFALKATQASPDNPAILDTLAATYAAEGNLAKAVETQRQVLAIAPEGQAYRLGLARLLVQSGDRAGARQELEKLRALGRKFEGYDEVIQLLRQIS